MSPDVKAAVDRSYTEIRHHILPGVWRVEKKKEARFLSQGVRGRYARRTGQEIREDEQGFAVLDALDRHFRMAERHAVTENQ